jgi:hypothetical protein
MGHSGQDHIRLKQTDQAKQWNGSGTHSGSTERVKIYTTWKNFRASIRLGDESEMQLILRARKIARQVGGDSLRAAAAEMWNQ